MNALVWNCQGVGNPLTVSRLKEFWRLHSPDLVFLMETKNKDSYLLWLQKHLGVDGGCFFVNPVGLARGLCLYWRKEVSFQIIFSSAHVIDGYVTKGQYRCRVTLVHAPNSAQDRRGLWEHLLETTRTESLDWLVGGDFNAITHADEKAGGADRQAWEMADFQRFIQESNLIDLGYIGYPFTWNNKRCGQDNVKVRLDRFLASPSWKIRHPDALVWHLTPGGSDHCPIFLNATVQKGKYKQRFFFYNRWGQQEDCASIVKNEWSKRFVGSKWYQIHMKIRACRVGLLQWRKQHQLNSRHMKEAMEAKLQLIFECPVFNYEEFSSAKLMLKKALQDEETYWRNKSRISWLKDGDKNTAFFHAQTLQRRQQNRLVGLENDMGVWQDGEDAGQMGWEQDFFNNFGLLSGRASWTQFEATVIRTIFFAASITPT
ncbi:hypothetical protein Vadar_028753 [Vaccinium darrowii]|uniref:Uncharacterized protein n=1 Tax=Vaccinium darrowii TaxID=229202 RepID=A0ACB7YSE9_9ERIC|nr:hypothetical protein Vadar_028753 [Vaccinium darrowii]